MDKASRALDKSAAIGASELAARLRWRDLTKDIQGSRFPNSYPRDAATLLIIDTAGPEPRLLMGQRHHKLKFMPGKFVFPGGRVEARDYLATIGCTLPAPVTAKLLRAVKGSLHPQRALALAHAALRETQEETGIVIGAPRAQGDGRSPGLPDFAGFSFLARAITPPRRPRRFDTRFFTVTADRIAGRQPIIDGEFIAVEWFTFAEARQQDLADITRMILSDLEERLEAGNLCDPNAAVPFYFMRGACFHRKLLR
ncbi:MAG: NUDIX hydrolase [Rhodomicrobium sp.]|nr:NUDIX hydrolase [Rhodomicrobium sp.]